MQELLAAAFIQRIDTGMHVALVQRPFVGHHSFGARRNTKAEDGAGHYVMRRSVFAIIFSSMSAVLSSRTFNCDASTTRTTQCIRTGEHGSTLQGQNARDRDKRQQLTKVLRSSCPVPLTVSSAARARFGVENKGIPTRRQTRVCSLSTVLVFFYFVDSDRELERVSSLWFLKNTVSTRCGKFAFQSARTYVAHR